MSFESGSISFRTFHVLDDLPASIVAKFAARQLPPIETLGDGMIRGWVGGRHVLDRVITQDNAYYGGYLRLSLVVAERKVPEALLRAESQLEEIAWLKAKGVDRLTANERREIRKSIESRLISHAFPILRSIPFVYDEPSQLLHAGAVSTSQMDDFVISFCETTGTRIVPSTVEVVALRQIKNVRDWPACSFSPEADSAEVVNDPGQDFLTWIWFASECLGGMFNFPGLGVVTFMIEAPLTLTMEGSGAHVTVLRRGEPLLSREAKSALLGGKKLRSCKLTMCLGDETYKCTIDNELCIRGLRLPETEKLDPVSRFQARMDSLARFKNCLGGLLNLFITVRSDAPKWASMLRDIHEWVTARKVRS